MAASQSSTCLRMTQITSSAQRRTLVCHHGVRLVFRVSGTKENPGRRFRGCVYYEVQEECGFFQWADQWVDREQVEVEKDQEKAKLRKKVVALKSKLKAMEGKMKIVGFLGLVGWLGFLCLWLQN
ncbi:hypothetical protein PIB30_099744 [Stylosanthes scabra]|uniref:GRF-type domain-containing protein n=1 Tax=Stylosanthes scabra TaxID=79078 RepID=A0ABU6WWK6_9FABA|nr:hypothetical protein [Stylosanthes scabra]